MNKYYFEKRNILIIGSTGLIGTELYKLFKQEGHSIKLLSTNRDFVESNKNAFYWNVDDKIIDEKAFEGVEVVVNLAGANVAGGYWTKKRKALLYNSRVLGTKLLAETCHKLQKKFKFYMGASAIGYYGPNNTNTPKVEDDAPGDDFLAKLCVDWEKQHRKFDDISEVLVIARISNVFSPKGGFALPFMKLSKFGIRVLLGKNLNYFSWIHVEDVARFFSAVLYMDIEGTFNITVDSSRWLELQLAMYRKFGDQVLRLAIPDFLIKIMLGEMSSMMLNGNYSSGNKLEEVAFMIKHVELDLILKDLIRKS